jgi:hypothetical protein
MKRTVSLIIALFISGVFIFAQDSVRKLSGDWMEYSRGSLFLQNNTCGKKSITDYEQSLLIDEKNGIIGWEWRWPDTYVDEGNYVKAYPEVIYGKKPWSGSSTVATMPELVSTCDKVIDFKLVHQSTGVNNTSFDIWLTATKEAAPKDISGDIMIWIDNNGMIAPGPNIRKIVTIDGIKYDFTVAGESTGDGKMNKIYFRTLSRMDVGSIRMKGILAFLIKEKLVNPKHYVASIELGNEIVTGEGKMILSKYEIK